MSLACWLDTPLILRGTSRHHAGWQWRYYEEPRAPVGVAVALGAFAVAAVGLQRAGRKRWLVSAAALSACTLLLQLSVTGLTREERGRPWPPLVREGEYSIYFADIERWRDIGVLFRDWPGHREELPPPHFPYHPPFSLLPVWLSQEICDSKPRLCYRLTQSTRTRRLAPSAKQAAVPLITALMGFAAAAMTPLLAAVLFRWRSERDPIAAAAACATLPALLTHVLTLDQFQVPLFAAAALSAQALPVVLGGFLGGAIVGVASQISFVSLALGNVVAALVCLRARLLPRRTLVAAAAAVASGAFAVLMVSELATGFSWPASLVLVLEGGHPEVLLKRTYVYGLWRNVLDVLVWCGPLAVIGFAGGAVTAVRRLLRREADVDPFPVAVAVGLGVLYLSGAIRAETGRIWMPYFPLVVVAALPTLRGLLPGRWLWVGGAAQLLHTWVLVTRWGN